MFPKGDGVREERGFDFYDRLIDGLLEAGIEPLATLYHWDLPQALQDKGGWVNRDIVNHFADYSTAVVERFGDRVKKFSPINEPWVVAWLGYGIGIHAPGIIDRRSAFPDRFLIKLTMLPMIQAIQFRHMLQRLAMRIKIVSGWMRLCMAHIRRS
jgi:beta-glucosidase/6-phospho-beta-glucosidase/beta-galactosidase